MPPSSRSSAAARSCQALAYSRYPAFRSEFGASAASRQAASAISRYRRARSSGGNRSNARPNVLTLFLTGQETPERRIRCLVRACHGPASKPYIISEGTPLDKPGGGGKCSLRDLSGVTPLPRYYFHIQEPNQTIRDDEGQECPDLESAKREAALSARELVAEGVRLGKGMRPHHCLQVADENGAVLATLRFSDAAR